MELGTTLADKGQEYMKKIYLSVVKSRVKKFNELSYEEMLEGRKKLNIFFKKINENSMTTWRES